MNCLCCGKPLRSNNNTMWHGSCISRFFNTTSIPQIDIDDKTLELIASQNIQNGFTVPGVQKKLSLHLLSNEEQPRLTLVNYPTGYILKPQVDDFANLPEAEHLVMSMANECGIVTVPHALIKQDGTYAYITKRVDRIFEKDRVYKLAMEDFCQLDLRITADKYKGSYERCAKIIEKYSAHPGYDISEFFMRLVFCFITGNSDMHLKNFSLVETEEGSGEYILSPAYDLLPVNLVMPQDKEQTALTLGGKKKNIRKKEFLEFAENCGLTKIAAKKMIDYLVSKKETLLEMCFDSLLPAKMKEDFSLLIEKRCGVL